MVEGPKGVGAVGPMSGSSPNSVRATARAMAASRREGAGGGSCGGGGGGRRAESGRVWEKGAGTQLTRFRDGGNTGEESGDETPPELGSSHGRI